MIPSANQYGEIARPASSSWIVPGRNPTPWTSFLAHRRLTVAIVAVVSLLGLVMAKLYLPDYVAEATIRVSPVVPASLAGEESQFKFNAAYRHFVGEQGF